MKFRWIHCLILISCFTTAQMAVGQTNKPTSNPSAAGDDVDFGSQALRGAKTIGNSSFFGGSGVPVESSGILDLLRIGIALAVVISVILILRTVVQNLGKLPNSKASGRLVTLLSRSVVSPKQQVMVLQVGKRLIVVGDSAGRMNTLCEISDPDEIAELVGQARNEQQSKIPGSFGNLFRSANQPFSDEQPTDESPMENVESIDGVTSEDVSGLMDKVKLLQQQFKTQNQV